MAAADRSLLPRIILLGDSITQVGYSEDGGWAALLENALARRCDVSARGFLGYNTRLWRSICRAVPPETLRGELALIFLGANDAASNNASQFVPLEEYKSNLADLSTYIQEQIGIGDVLLITPPPADESAMSQGLLDEGRSGALTAQYATACREAASELNLPLVDLHTHFLEQENWQSLLIDGLHFSKAGSQFAFSVIEPVVRQLVDKYMPSNMGLYDQILPAFYEASNVYPSPEIFEWVQNHPLPDAKKELNSKPEV